MFNSQQNSKLFWKLSFCSIKLCVKPINWLENLINFKYPRHHIYLLLHKAWLWWKYLGVVHELCYIYFAAKKTLTQGTQQSIILERILVSTLVCTSTNSNCWYQVCLLSILFQLWPSTLLYNLLLKKIEGCLNIFSEQPLMVHVYNLYRA